MNNKPKLRFKEFDNEWNCTDLEQICNIYDGTHQTPNYQDAGIQFLSVENIKNIDASSKYISEEDYRKDFKVRPELNDILMTRIGDIGTPALIKNNKDYAYYVSLALLKCKKGIFPSYLVQAIINNNFQKQLWKNTLHVAFPKKINKGDIGKCKIKYPSLQEQQKIAELLSKVDEIIAEREEEVKDLEQQKKGLMQKIFSQQLRFRDSNNNPYPDWKETILGSVFDTITDFVAAGSFADIRKNVEYKNTPDYAQLVRTVDIKKRFTNNDFVYVNELAYKYLWRVNLDEGVLVLPNIGANIGESYYIEPSMLPHKHSVLGPNAILLKSHNNNLQYLYQYTLTDNFKKNLFLCVGASGQPKFNKTELKTLNIPLPCLEEQQKIANLLSKMDELIEEKKALLIDWQQFKKGLLQQMFV